MNAAPSTSVKFNRELAERLLAASAFAYSPNDDEGFFPDCPLLEQGDARPAVWRNSRKIAGETVAVCIIRRHDAQIIAFRGTESCTIENGNGLRWYS